MKKMADMAGKCWDLFGLRGYGRVDFRVDEEGRPWVLEVNANPCLSPDAGFVAAAFKGGLGFEGVIKRIIQDTCLCDSTDSEKALAGASSLK